MYVKKAAQANILCTKTMLLECFREFFTYNFVLCSEASQMGTHKIF